MTWQNLSEDLTDLFSEFTTRTDALMLSLERSAARARENYRVWHREYQRIKRLDKAWVAAFNAYRRARYGRADVREHEIARVRAWQKANREKVLATKARARAKAKARDNAQRQSIRKVFE